MDLLTHIPILFMPLVLEETTTEDLVEMQESIIRAVKNKKVDAPSSAVHFKRLCHCPPAEFVYGDVKTLQ